MRKRTVFLDIDTQADFMLPEGALYVPAAIEIIPKLRKLMDYARHHGILVLSDADAHPPDDPSFAQWPPHCLIGTPGQRRIPETQFPSPLVIPNRPGAFTPPAPRTGQIIIEKTEYDIASNPNFDAILACLGAVQFIAFGVATDYCVRFSVLSIRRRGFPVDLLVDAIRGIDEVGSREALEEMAKAGVRFLTMADVTDDLLTKPLSIP
jgi:nicotinamidase/pyrazinamidase